MKIIRWIAFIPGAAITGVLMSILAGIPLSFAHGWKFLSELLNAPDMAGRYIVGTYCLVLVRGALGAGSTWAAYRIAPSVKLRAAYVWFVLLALTLCLFLIYLNLAISRAHLQLTFSTGWRAIVEAAGLLGGSFLAIQILREEDGIITTGAAALNATHVQPALSGDPLDLVTAYGSILEHRKGMLMPASSLPASKSDLKAAILAVAGSPPPNAPNNLLDLLEVAYCELAYCVPDNVAKRENALYAATLDGTPSDLTEKLSVTTAHSALVSPFLDEYTRLSKEFQALITIACNRTPNTGAAPDSYAAGEPR